jgi:hypothetical protein
MLRIAEIGRSGERYILTSGFAELADIIANLVQSNNPDRCERY